jgi:hypothetical protein
MRWKIWRPEMSGYPKIDRGFYHLLADGWLRKDTQPFPADRLETWAYEMEVPAEDAKERVCLTRTWRKPGMSSDGLGAFHACFGEAMYPSPSRNVTLECEV